MRRLIITIMLVAVLILPSIANSCCGRTSPDGYTVDEIEEIFDEIVDWVVENRSLELLSDIEYEFISTDNWRQKLIEDFEEGDTQNEMQIIQELLVLLGLLEKDDDLYTLRLDQLSDGVSGYYEYEDQKLYVIGNPEAITVGDRVTFAHEVTHALQDQHYNLQSLVEQSEDDSEYSFAVRSLIEGDASVVTAFYYNNLSTQDQNRYDEEINNAANDQRDDIPLYLQESLAFPYTYGALFAYDLYLEGGWEAVDDAYNNLPKSSEQIIHSNKYPSDEPVIVNLPDLEELLGSSWEIKNDGSVGEFDIRMTLEAFITPSETTEDAAAGWGGDSYAYLKNDGGDKLLVIHSVWDSANDAQEFFDLYADNRAGTDINDNNWILSINDSGKKIWAADSLVTHLEISESDVVLIIAPDTTIANLVRNAVLT